MIRYNQAKRSELQKSYRHRPKALYYVRYGVMNKGIDLVIAIVISSIINAVFETLKYYNT
jgi:hypothetical protein